MQYKDLQKKCINCGRDFTDRAKDQAFREKKGWVRDGNIIPMTRCAECRAARKAAKGLGGGEYHDR
jgi:hypothetical protein